MGEACSLCSQGGAGSTTFAFRIANINYFHIHQNSMQIIFLLERIAKRLSLPRF
jgi:hypothetical protein